jgi:hypothetical protein
VINPVPLALPPAMLKPLSCVVGVALLKTPKITWCTLSAVSPTTPISPLKIVVLTAHINFLGIKQKVSLI